MCDTKDGSWGRYCQYSNALAGGSRMADGASMSAAAPSPLLQTPEFRALLRAHITSTIDIIVDDVLPKNRAMKQALDGGDGDSYPLFALSMIGRGSLKILADQVVAVIDAGIEGDLVETGVWKGGASILMSVIVHALRQSHRRRVFVCDSFDGVPPPNRRDFPVDGGSRLHTQQGLKIEIDSVVENFLAMRALHDNVFFVKGFFNESMSQMGAVSSIALLRLDGDLYESTLQVLRALYPRLAVGGYCVVDDWGLDNGWAKQAVMFYFSLCNAAEQVQFDGVAWWVKTRNVAAGCM
jgi:O-methyltransferase